MENKDDELWRQGYRDGWDGKRTPAIAPGLYAAGWREGEIDRHRGIARAQYAFLAVGKPGQFWSDRG